MKAGEAPEKIYCHRNEHGYVAFSVQPFNYAEEYVNADSFIDKACEYLEPIIFSMNLGDRPDTDKFIEDFKKHMKGE